MGLNPGNGLVEGNLRFSLRIEDGHGRAIPVAAVQQPVGAKSRTPLQDRHQSHLHRVAQRGVVAFQAIAYYADAAPDGGLDTVERDALLDVLGRHFTGQPWPRSGGMDATRRFMTDLQRAMTKMGWSVDFFAVA